MNQARHTSHITLHALITHIITHNTSHITRRKPGKQPKERKNASLSFLTTLGPKHVFGCPPKEASSSSRPQQSTSPPSSAPAQSQQQLNCSLICSSSCTFAFLPAADLSKIDEKSRSHLDAALHQQQELVDEMAAKITETRYK
jgi:hypothetical protein